MPRVDVVVDCPVHDSFRVQQVAGMFDLPLSERSREQFSLELPDRDEDWSIGLVVGPSGSGKSTIAREHFGDALYQAAGWPRNAAVIDGFDRLPIRQATGLFTAVGFSSPPAWVKPYHVLSGGERFRCDLARALSVGCVPELADAEVSDWPLVVFDEYTSVVDRQVAKVCSAAIAKAVRRRNIRCRFVAVSCHYDIARWLEADWVVDTAAGTLSRRRLRRPPIELRISRCGRDVWRRFARHHYLTGSLSPSARCYVATWNGVPVTFCATIPIIGRRGHWRFTRIVTLPDYQGIGIGMRTVEAIASLYRQEGLRINVTTSHPAVIGHAQRDNRWRIVRVKKTGTPGAADRFRGYHGSAGRAVVSMEFVGEGQSEGDD